MKKLPFYIIVIGVIHVVLITLLLCSNKKPDEPESAKPDQVTQQPHSLDKVKESVPDKLEIAAPVVENRAGYLRNDLPDNRTNKAFGKLVKAPYRGAIVIDADTGKILFEKDANAYAYPASVTKLMTLLLLLEDVEAGKSTLDDVIAIPKAACRVGGSQVYLDPRESFSLHDLANAMVIHSANDAAAAVGIHVGGDLDSFIKLMNKRAKELGMTSTVYHSPNGLPVSANVQADISSAHDIALLSRELLKNDNTLLFTGNQLEYLPLTPLRKERFMLATRNKLIKNYKGYKGCDGLKTGYISRGGWSISATAERSGKRVIAVVLGSTDSKTRSQEVRKLLDLGFDQLGLPAE